MRYAGIKWQKVKSTPTQNSYTNPAVRGTLVVSGTRGVVVDRSAGAFKVMVRMSGAEVEIVGVHPQVMAHGVDTKNWLAGLEDDKIPQFETE